MILTKIASWLVADIFVGNGVNQGYIDGEASLFDFFEISTWSLGLIHNVVEELHYQAASEMNIYWYLTRKI